MSCSSTHSHSMDLRETNELLLHTLTQYGFKRNQRVARPHTHNNWVMGMLRPVSVLYFLHKHIHDTSWKIQVSHWIESLWSFDWCVFSRCIYYSVNVLESAPLRDDIVCYIQPSHHWVSNLKRSSQSQRELRTLLIVAPYSTFGNYSDPWLLTHFVTFRFVLKLI
jgi:hypothetical protein